MARHPPLVSFRKIPWAALALLLVVSLSALPVVAGAATHPLLTVTYAREENIVVDGGFEEETVKYSPLVCPCPLMLPWVTNQSGKGGASAQRGWGTGGSYAAVVSLDDSKTGDWISLSQSVSGGEYSSLSFTYSTWLSGGRESDLAIYLDDTLVWFNHEKDQARQPHIKKLGLALPSFSGIHTLRFLQNATTGGTGHSDWFIDDVQLLAASSTSPGPATTPPVTNRSLPAMSPAPKNTGNQSPALISRNGTPPTSLPPTGTTALPRQAGAEPATPRPVITRPAPFDPFRFLSCLARRIHDEVFPFMPLKQGTDPGCT
jgi:hypothetical protein